jgi:hypothetical protein
VTAEPRHILVLANETVAGTTLLDALRRRAANGPIRVTVVSPQNESRAGFVVYETSSGWLRRDLVERVRKATGLPVAHVVVEPSEAKAVAS